MRVVVIGAGYAGLAAAIRLQERRHEVLLLERRGILGGRATSTRDAVTGDAVDNGTHVMLGGYHATLDLIRRAGADDLLLAQDNLRIDYVDDRGRSRLQCPAVVAPLHLGLGLMGLRLPLRARLDCQRLAWALRFGRRPSGMTLTDYLCSQGQSQAARRLVWDPLATAILNVTPDRADAGVFFDVLRLAFLRSARDSRLVFLRAGWGDLAERLGRYFEGRDGRIRFRALAEAIDIDERRVSGVRFTLRPQGREEIASGVRSQEVSVAADAVVSAVPWNAVASLLPEACRAQPPFDSLPALGASPIVSLDLWLDRVVVDREMVGLRDEEMEWVFDKGRLHGRAGAPQHLSFIVSAARRSMARGNAELVASAEKALARYFPAMKEAKVVRSLVMRDPEATFDCRPGSQALRPGPLTPIGGLFLAGDWTDTGLPATIEGAVESGIRAADAVEEAEKGH
jgi:squalene-associated FAD-dependent desaturase